MSTAIDCWIFSSSASAFSDSNVNWFRFSFPIRREHLLHRMLQPIAATQVTQEMYEDQSFMRRKGLLTFLRQILEPLDEFHIVLENSLTQGIPSLL